MRELASRIVGAFTVVSLLASLGHPLAGQSPRDTLVTVGEFRLHFRVYPGDGPTVLLESGAGLGASQWDEVAPRIVQETGATVVAYDRAGFGASDLPTAPYDVSEEVAGLWQGLEHLGLNADLLLVGHSYGGFLIQLTAHRHPEAVLGLVFVDPNLASFMDEIGGREGLDALFPPRPSQGESKAERALSRLMDGIDSTVAQLLGTSVPTFLPVRVITAGQPWWPTPEANQAFRAAHEKLASSTREGRLLVAEQSGHMITETQPELIVAVVRELILGDRRGP